VAFSLPIDGDLDLHAFTPRDIPSVVDEYLRAAHEKGLGEIRIVHGRGRGVQRAIVQTVLRDHEFVAAFWDDPRAHLGATICRLKST
jgi:DNA-nicking Smr family endonuclease